MYFDTGDAILKTLLAGSALMVLAMNVIIPCMIHDKNMGLLSPCEKIVYILIAVPGITCYYCTKALLNLMGDK